MQYIFNDRRVYITSIEFRNTIPILNIEKIRSIKEEGVTGNFTKKEFRYSFDNVIWSPWDTLTTAKLVNISFANQSNFYLHIKYSRTKVIDGNIGAFYLTYDSRSTSLPSPDSSTIDADLLQGEDGEYYLNRENHFGSFSDLNVQNVIDGSSVGVYFGRTDSSLGSTLFFKRIEGEGGAIVSESSSGIILIDVPFDILDASISDIYNIINSIEASIANIDSSINDIWTKISYIDVSLNNIVTTDSSILASKVIYDPSTLDPSLAMPSAVGGIPIGTIAGQLAGDSVTSILNDLLFPTVQPILNAPSASFDITSIEGYDISTMISYGALYNWNATQIMEYPAGYGILYNWHATTNKSNYGYLYNWYAATYQTIRYGYLYNGWVITDSRNIAAAGAHVPTNEEYFDLMIYIDPSGTYNVNNAGKKLKEIGSTYWDVDNVATNEYGFNARGAGQRGGIDYELLKIDGRLWTSSPVPTAFPVDAYLHIVELITYRDAFYISDPSNPWFFSKVEGLPIRLVMDDTSLGNGESGTYTGNDGRIYRTICINDIEYLADNLTETKYRNGNDIPEVQDYTTFNNASTGARCSYNNYESYAFGGVNPIGWHVPSSSELEVLSNEVGGFSTAGQKLKETGLTHWNTPNYATNDYNFNLVGGGYRTGDTGGFQYLKQRGYIMSKTENTYVDFRWTGNNAYSLGYGTEYKTTGMSIRLIKDDSINEGSIVDYDGNIYPTVKIGDQVWMAANLAVEHYDDGVLIPNIVGSSEWISDVSGALCDVNGDPSNTFCNIAPTGWHLPTFAEYTTLANNTGGWGYAGAHFREAGYNHWDAPNTGADNSTGFTLLGSGIRYYNDGTFGELKGTWYGWSSSEYHSDQAKAFITYNGSSSFFYMENNKNCGHSIRLIKDDSINVGRMSDYDGNTYPTVKIGDQVWMAANLAVTHYNNGDEIQLITNDFDWVSNPSLGAMCYYNNDPCSNWIDLLNIAPVGWHLPTITELNTLLNFYGGAVISAPPLKQSGTNYWLPGNNGTNESGLSLLGSGDRDVDGFWDTKYFFYGWLDNSTATYWYADYIDIYVGISGDDIGEIGLIPETNGISIRLIKDNSINTGSMIDYDSNVYPTVKIGDQVWMAANLSVEHYRDGRPIPIISDNSDWVLNASLGAMCYYDNDPYSNKFMIVPITNNTTIYEVNTDISVLQFTTSFNRGSIYNASTYQDIRSGLPNSYLYNNAPNLQWTIDASWEDSNYMFYISSISFVDEFNGWSVGNDVSGYVMVLNTSDGGTTWNQQSLPLNVGWLTIVKFVDINNGWVAGKDTDTLNMLVFNTSDGGNNWVQQSTPLQYGITPVSIDFVDSSIGWIIGVDLSYTLITFNTSDGGNNWVQQYAPTGEYTQIYGLDFIDSNNGWVVSVDSLGYAFIINTSDGGANWTQQAPATYYVSLSAVSFLNASEGLAVGISGNTYASIYKTIDGGITWTSQLFTPGSLLSVKFVDPNNAWAAGYDPTGSVIFNSIDGGLTWNKQNLPINQAGGIVSVIDFIDSVTGYAFAYYSNNTNYIFKYSDINLVDVSSNSLSDVQSFNYRVNLGINTWSAQVGYDGGPQPLDNKGNYAINGPLPAGILSAYPQRSIEGSYPYYATTAIDITTIEKQQLVSLNTNPAPSSSGMNLQAEYGGYKQAFEIPNTRLDLHALSGIRTYNTISSQWEYELGSALDSLTRWTTASAIETIQGVDINYTRYTYNGIDRAGVSIRLEF